MDGVHKTSPSMIVHPPHLRVRGDDKGLPMNEVLLLQKSRRELPDRRFLSVVPPAHNDNCRGGHLEQCEYNLLSFLIMPHS